MQQLTLPAVAGSNEPAWTRTIFLTPEGQVLIAAALAGNEQRVFMRAAHDGVQAVVDKKHYYLPTDWLAQNYNKIAELCANAEAIVRNRKQ